MASGIYNRFKSNLMNKVMDLVNSDIYCALYDNSHAFTATDTVYTTTNELTTAGGYTQGGKLVGNKSVTEAATTKWDADDVSWTGATFTAYHAVLYVDRPSGGTNDLICSIDFGGAKTVSAGTFTIVWDAAGIITLA